MDEEQWPFKKVARRLPFPISVRAASDLAGAVDSAAVADLGDGTR